MGKGEKNVDSIFEEEIYLLRDPPAILITLHNEKEKESLENMTRYTNTREEDITKRIDGYSKTRKVNIPKSLESQSLEIFKKDYYAFSEGKASIQFQQTYPTRLIASIRPYEKKDETARKIYYDIIENIEFL